MKRLLRKKVYSVVGEEVMSGREWYIRFNKHLEKVLPHELKGFDNEDALGIRTVVDTAAKRASNITEDSL